MPLKPAPVPTGLRASGDALPVGAGPFGRSDRTSAGCRLVGASHLGNSTSTGPALGMSRDSSTSTVRRLRIGFIPPRRRTARQGAVAGTPSAAADVVGRVVGEEGVDQEQLALGGDPAAAVSGAVLGEDAVHDQRPAVGGIEQPAAVAAGRVLRDRAVVARQYAPVPDAAVARSAVASDDSVVKLQDVEGVIDAAAVSVRGLVAIDGRAIDGDPAEEGENAAAQPGGVCFDIPPPAEIAVDLAPSDD